MRREYPLKTELSTLEAKVTRCEDDIEQILAENESHSNKIRDLSERIEGHQNRLTAESELILAL